MSQFKLTLAVIGSLLGIILVGTIVFQPYRIRHDKAVEAIMEQDAELAHARDQSTKNKSAGRSVTEYVQAIKRLDFSKTPDEFKEAFNKHIDAWDKSITFLEQHAETRGEMHELLGKIQAKDRSTKLKLDAIQARIFATWREVEDVAKDHGYVAETE